MLRMPYGPEKQAGSVPSVQGEVKVVGPLAEQV